MALNRVRFVGNPMAPRPLAAPTEPAPRVAEGVDFALFVFVDDLDGHELDPEPSGEKLQQHLGFDLEMIRGDRETGPDRELD